MLCQPADEKLAHCRVVDDLRTPQRLESRFREHGESRTPVCRVGLSANETPFLEAGDYASDPAGREHSLGAEAAHAQSQVRGGDKRDQDAVVGE